MIWLKFWININKIIIFHVTVYLVPISAQESRREDKCKPMTIYPTRDRPPRLYSKP